jgi:hypothetical protein
MAPKLKRVGFYREFGYGDDAPSLRDAVRETEEYDCAAMAGYLRAAPMLAAAPGVVRDVLDPEASAVMTRSLKTDGVYEWPVPLAYHVAKYHLTLPADFVAHAAARGFKPPTREELDLPTG